MRHVGERRRCQQSLTLVLENISKGWPCLSCFIAGSLLAALTFYNDSVLSGFCIPSAYISLKLAEIAAMIMMLFDLSSTRGIYYQNGGKKNYHNYL